MRNQYPGTCYKCQAQVAIGGGFFERHNGGWRVQCAGCSNRGGNRKLSAAGASESLSLDRPRDAQPGQTVQWSFMPEGGCHSLQRVKATGTVIGIIRDGVHITKKMTPEAIARLALDFRRKVYYRRALLETADGRLHLVAVGNLTVVTKSVSPVEV